MIAFQCPSCHTGYRVSDDRAGKQGKCKQCGAAITVPSSGISLQDFESLESSSQGIPSQGHGPHAPHRSRRFAKPTGNQIIGGRPLPPDKEESVRRRNFITIGIMLLIGFACPIFIPTGRGGSFSFPNIEELGNSPDVISLIGLLFPLAAGIAAIAIAQVGIPGRGWLTLVLGLVPVFLSVIQAMETGQLPGFGRSLRGEGVIVMGLALLLLVGFYCLFIAARVRWYRPNSSAAFTVGLIGAIAMLLLLCIPIEGMPIIAGAFLLLGEVPRVGVVLIVSVLTALIASLLSLANTPSRPMKTASSTAWLIHRLLMLSILALIVMITLTSMRIRGSLSQMELIALVVLFLKFSTLVVPVVALAPMGIIDLMIGQTQRHGHCFQCDYDLRGIESGVCPECGFQNEPSRVQAMA